jgi:hypothetical protein
MSYSGEILNMPDENFIALCNERRTPIIILCNYLSDAEAESFLMALCQQFYLGNNPAIGVYRGPINPEVNGFSITHDRISFIHEIEFNLDCIIDEDRDLCAISDAIDTVLLHQREPPAEDSRLVEMIQRFDPTLTYANIVTMRANAISRDEREQQEQREQEQQERNEMHLIESTSWINERPLQ